MGRQSHSTGENLRIGPRINHHKMTWKAKDGLESNNIGSKGFPCSSFNSLDQRKNTQFGGQQSSSFLSKYDTKESFLHSNVAYKVLNLNNSKKTFTTTF